MTACDRCGGNASGRGTLPTDTGERYRFCAHCWGELHQWVEEGGEP